MKRWWVVSPEYQTFGGGEYEPPEWGCDAIEIEAETKRDALMLGVQELLKDEDSWPGQNRQDCQPPWAGMRVEPSPPCTCCGEYEACRCDWSPQGPVEPDVCLTHPEESNGEPPKRRRKQLKHGHCCVDPNCNCDD